MTKRTRRRLAAAGGSARAALAPAAEPVGELLRSDLVTFGAASLEVLSAWPDLLERIAPAWEAEFWREHAWLEALPLAND